MKKYIFLIVACCLVVGTMVYGIVINNQNKVNSDLSMTNQTLIEKIDTTMVEFNFLKEEYEKLKSDSGEKITSLVSERDRLNALLFQANEQLDKSMQENLSLTLEKHNLEKQIEELNNQIEILNNQIIELEKQGEEKTAEIEKLKNKVIDLQEKVIVLQDDDLEKLNEISDLQKQIKSLESDIENYKLQIANLELSNEGLLAKCDNYENQISDLNSQINVLVARLNENNQLFQKLVSGQITKVTALDLNGMTSLNSYAFYGCKSLVSIEIPDSVFSIGDYAFYGCTSLKDVKLSKNITKLSQYLFAECTSLPKVTIPEGVEIVSACVFNGCKSMSEIVIPSSVTEVGYNAFATLNYQICDFKYNSTINNYCMINFGSVLSCPLYFNFKNIYLKNDKDEYEILSRNLVLDVTSVSSHAFVGYVYSVKFSDNLTSLGKGVFYGNKDLVSVELGNSLKKIEDETFRTCSSLRNLTIPASVTEISNYYTFYFVGSINITFKSSVPPIFNYNPCFNQGTSFKMYVPYGSLETYKNADGWASLSSYFYELPEETVTA